MKTGFTYRFRDIFLLFSAFMITLLLTSTPVEAGFKDGYTLSGSSAEKMVNIAQKQEGRTKSQMGYSQAWCASFVSDVAKIAGESKAIPYHSGCGGLWNAVVKAGGKEVKSPQKGDLVFFYCDTCLKYVDGKPYCHVAIMKNANTCISGNYNNAVAVHSTKSYYDQYGHGVGKGITLRYLRPAYKNASAAVKPSYFDCNVQIDCIKGKTVNLYKNVGDDTRADYFDRGQSMTSTYGAKLDGATWYRISARSSSGSVANYWLKYESSKMSVKNLNQTQTYSATASFDRSTLSMDMNQNTVQTVTLKIGGNLPSKCGIRTSMSNPDVASIDWSSKNIPQISYPAITAKRAGNTTLTCEVVDLNSNQVLATAKMNIQVTATVAEYTIRYDANGGTGAPSAQTKKSGEFLRLSYQEPVRDGYKFAGWALPGNDYSSYISGDIYSTDESVTLTAIWLPIDKPIVEPEPTPEPEPAPESKPVSKTVSLWFEPSSVSLELDKNSQKTVKLSVEGDFPENGQLRVSKSNANVFSVDWGGTSIRNEAYPVITAKKAGNGTMTCKVVDGNSGNVLAEASLYISVTEPPKETYPQYFDCDVRIDCINGKTVNLYKNFNDRGRVDYFDRGQTAYASEGVRLEDGSTWYKIKARSSVDGNVYNYWIKYESGKMRIIN